MAKKKFYVVWEGREKGIFKTWAECQASVGGHPGAKYMGFETLAEAEVAFRGNYWKFAKVGSKKAMVAKTGETGSSPLKDALSVDAACSGNPGVMEYRGVWVGDGSEYFRMGPYPEGTVNIGEFLAIVHGLALLKKEGLTVPVYTDSKTAMKWVRDCRANTKLAQNELNSQLFDYIHRAEAWLKNNKYTNPVLKWDTRGWGEIPADYGRK
ncbi:MAG: ribonuclease H family protein [Bacteroidales bacterium]